MKPINLTLLAALFAVAGTWSQKGTISTREVVGIGTLSFFMVILTQAQPKLAEQFGWLLVVATASAYGEDLFTNIGNITAATAGKSPENPK
jgi:hypothetical protein